ncbi:signal peptidase I [Actinokineospora cianjurensis]|uniref:Signal peptidase I n=1 Tax=Actinokineospora cianjurensis TaxID=585224 RepID=A0A421B3T8_9PSEU|nr:signal peptidase I [Actinokineospora cianjurensis]
MELSDAAVVTVTRTRRTWGGRAVSVLSYVAGSVLSGLFWLVAWCVLPIVLSWHSYVVLSGSMSPAIRTGDVVVVGDLLTDHPAPGAVVAFDDPTRPDHVLMHRVLKVNDDATLVTKGDANADADSTPVTEQMVHGQGRLRVPWVGLPAYWVRIGDWMSLLAAIAVLAGLAVLAWRRPGKPTQRPPGIGPPRRAHRRPTTTTRRVLLVAVVGVLLFASMNGGFAAWTATSANAGNALGSSATFPTYSASVTGDSPLFYHRQEEAQSSSATSTAADSSTNNRPGQFNMPTNGPYTHWRFDEGTGTNTGDNSGSVDTGVLTNGPTWGTGVLGGAVVFDGVNDRVIGATNPIATDTSFSVSIWVKTTSASGTAVAITHQGANTGAWYLYQQGGKWRFGMPRTDSSSGTEDYAQSTTSTAASTWVHLVGVYDDPNNAIRIYVNGSLETSQARADAYEWKATGSLVAGGILRGGSWLYPWSGSLDDARVYQRVLGASEISGIYDAATAPNAQYNLEQSGTSATDSGPYGYTGTLQNGAAWNTTGRTGRSVTFDGIDDYISASTFTVRTDTSFTAAAWVYISSAGGVDRTFLAKDGLNVNSFALSYIPATTKYAFTMPASDTTGASTVRVSSSSSAIANAWTYVVGVWDSVNNQMKIYLNGVLEGTTSRSGGWNATGALSIGRGYNGSAGVQNWPGRIDEVQLYNRVLTAAEVDDIYTRPSMDWQYDDNLATTVSDSSGNSNYGTMNNVQWSDTSVAGTSGYFDGSSSWTVSQAASLRTDESFTVSGWAYLTTPNGDRSIVAQQGSVGSGYLLGADIASTRWCFRIPRTDANSPTYDAVYSSAIAQQNGWYHIVGVYQSGTEIIRLYVNGVLQDTASRGGTPWNATGTVQAGRALRSGSQMDYFYGYLDKVRTIQAALSTSQVQDLYNEGSPAPPALPVAGALSPMTAGQVGALQGAQQGQTASTAVAFNGTANASNLTSFANPSTFTIETWFKTSSPWGGLIAGFYNTTSASSTSRDRVIYLDKNGKLVFAVNPSTIKSITSATTYTDGTWHHVSASLGAAGMKLYVDGNLVAQDATTTTAQNFTGYWRWGGGGLPNYPNRPSSDYLVGTLDEFAVYGTQLTDAQVRRHYHANH